MMQGGRDITAPVLGPAPAPVPDRKNQGKQKLPVPSIAQAGLCPKHPRVWYFPVPSTTDVSCLSAELADDVRPACPSHVRSGDGTLWMRVSFMNLLLFGTDAQRAAFDKYRRAYLTGLLEAHCNAGPGSECSWELTGSVSAVSDMDFTLNEVTEKRWSDYNMIGRKTMDIIKAISAAHDKRYPYASMAELFDSNCYSSTFVRNHEEPIPIGGAGLWRTVPKKSPTTPGPAFISYLGMKDGAAIPGQRAWAHVRLYKNILKSKRQDLLRLFLDNVEPRMAAEVAALWAEHAAVARVGGAEGDRLRYKKIVDGATALRYIDSDPAYTEEERRAARAVNSVSAKAFFERDAYYTMAAFLIITQKRDYPDMPLGDADYVDCILDNAGFATKAFSKRHMCAHDLGSVLKMCKYIHRIAAAVLCMSSASASDKRRARAIYNAAKAADDRRKDAGGVSGDAGWAVVVKRVAKVFGIEVVGENGFDMATVLLPQLVKEVVGYALYRVAL